MPDMPMPPIPMKWMGPMSSGRAVGGFMGVSGLIWARAGVAAGAAAAKRGPGLSSRDATDHVGERLRGLRAAERAGGIGHAAGGAGIGQQRLQIARERLGREP